MLSIKLNLNCAVMRNKENKVTIAVSVTGKA